MSGHHNPPREPDASAADPGAAAREPRWSDRWLLPAVREPTLWPVLLVMIGCVAAFGAALLLLALRDRRLPALLAFAIVVVASSAALRAEIRDRGRPGVVTGLVLASWGTSGVVAVLGHRYGAF